jgi:hypothetical protein
VDLFDACEKDLAGALLALSEAAIKFVESAGKIQTRMFIGRAHATTFRRRQSKGRTNDFAADSPAFSGERPISRSTKDKAVHAQTGKLCRLQGSCERRKKP